MAGRYDARDRDFIRRVSGSFAFVEATRGLSDAYVSAGRNRFRLPSGLIRHETVDSAIPDV
jgi:hypothetical protein